MYHLGRLAILGINIGEIEDDIYTLLSSPEIFERLEAYKEVVDRRPHSKFDPDRAFYLTYHITDGTHTKKLEEAAKASAAVTPLKDESFG